MMESGNETNRPMGYYGNDRQMKMIVTIFSRTTVRPTRASGLMEEEVDESVSEALCYKQRLEKSTGAEMFLMKWSPVADLLAAACSDHSVRHNHFVVMISVHYHKSCSFFRCYSTVSLGSVCGAFHLLNQQFLL